MPVLHSWEGVSTCQCLIAYSATRLLPSKRKQHPCARRLDVKGCFFCAFASSLPQFRPSDCEATLEKKRLLSSRPDMYLQKVMDLKGSLFWCLFQLISKSSKHSNIQRELESNIQVSQMRVAAERARAAESATLRSALTEVRAEAEAEFYNEFVCSFFSSSHCLMERQNSLT